MKKPTRIVGMASPEQARKLGCMTGALTVVMTEADFERLWKLAKEAIHTEQAHQVEEP